VSGAGLKSDITDLDLGVPSQDSADNVTVSDVVGNKTDTTSGDSLVALNKQVKAKTDNLPTDPADQSQVEGAIATAHSTTDSKIDTVDGYQDVPTADSASNAQMRDVIGNKTDTTAGDSLVALVKNIDVGTDDIRKFPGNIYYVDAAEADDTADGTTPETAKKTIGAAIGLLVAGDAIVIKAGIYTEINLNLNVANCQLWPEIGTVIKPASNTALTISASYCKVWCPGGSLLIDPDGANTTGMLITGNFCYISDVRVKCDSVADIGFDIGETGTAKGSGCVLDNCRSSAPLIAAFKIQGDKVKLEDCCTGGETTSIGFWVTDSCDKCRIKNSGSEGHQTSGFQVDAGCTNGVIKDCSSGGGDGRWTDADHAFVWSDFTYDNEIHKVITLTATGGDVASDGKHYNLFKVTGAVKVHSIFGVIETLTPGTNSTVNLELYSTNAQPDITDSAGAPDLINRCVGTVLSRESVATDPLEMGEPDSTPAVIENTSFRDPRVPVILVKDDAADTYIQMVLSAALATGKIDWHCQWEPISDNGFLQAA